MAAALFASHVLTPIFFSERRQSRFYPFSLQKLSPKPKAFPKINFQFCNFFSLSARTARICAQLASSDPYQSSVEASDNDFQSYSTLRKLCEGHVPGHVLARMEEVGFVFPTDVQRQALPILFSGRDCILHAQTGSGKTLTYLLLINSIINTRRSAVQAVIVVPTRELGIQVTKVARVLAAKPTDHDLQDNSYTVMALLDGGTLRRHRSWLKAEPPAVVVATVDILCQMLEKHAFSLDAMQILVIDEVDFLFGSSKQVSSLRKLLTTYSSCNARQTVLASASIPQHRRFAQDCIQHKWTKNDVVHVHVNPVEPMPARIHHRCMICHRDQRFQALLSLLQSDAPESAIIFVNEQSEKSKRAGEAPPETLLVDLLESKFEDSDVLLLEENMNLNSRAASLLEARTKGGYLLVATDIAARGVDLPETTHIYNFDLPKTAVHYLHRAGRTGRKPFSDDKCIVTSMIAPEERFVLQKFENELKFNSTVLKMN
ncbi:hypothetical protein V2J09_011421 [Rumex salicifolius]